MDSEDTVLHYERPQKFHNQRFKLAFISFIHSVRTHSGFCFGALCFAFYALHPKNLQISLPPHGVSEKDVAGNGNVLGRRNYHGSQRKGAQRGARLLLLLLGGRCN